MAIEDNEDLSIIRIHQSIDRVELFSLNLPPSHFPLITPLLSHLLGRGLPDAWDSPGGAWPPRPRPRRLGRPSRTL